MMRQRARILRTVLWTVTTVDPEAVRNGVYGLVMIIVPIIVRQRHPAVGAQAAGVVVARVQSNASGRFAVDVPAGKYVLDPVAPGPGRFPSAGPIDVTVPAAGRASVTVAYDTGIR